MSALFFSLVTEHVFLVKWLLALAFSYQTDTDSFSLLRSFLSLSESTGQSFMLLLVGAPVAAFTLHDTRGESNTNISKHDRFHKREIKRNRNILLFVSLFSPIIIPLPLNVGDNCLCVNFKISRAKDVLHLLVGGSRPLLKGVHLLHNSSSRPKEQTDTAYFFNPLTCKQKIHNCLIFLD